MKALNKKTGEIATDFAIKEFGTISYFDKNKTLRLATACDNEWTIIDEEESYFDWKSFRAETAKDILCATLSGGTASGMIGIVPEKETLVKASIEIVDELIKQLQNNEIQR